MPRQGGMADREPCPWRIIDDVGGAFCMGAIGGAIWHGIKGLRNSPGRWEKVRGSFNAVQSRAPVLGGQFAVWGGLFACCDCTISYFRQKVSSFSPGVRRPLNPGNRIKFSEILFGHTCETLL